jgi:hypothetical protein
MNSNKTETSEAPRAAREKKDQNVKSLVTRISEAIRFHQWIDRMDQKDQKLDPAKRKKKWGTILGSFFLLYLLSFFVFPKPGLDHKSIPMESGTHPDRRDTPDNKKSLSFEMPVDSFENALKKHVYESLPEKK